MFLLLTGCHFFSCQKRQSKTNLLIDAPFCFFLEQATKRMRLRQLCGVFLALHVAAIKLDAADQIAAKTLIAEYLANTSGDSLSQQPD